MVKKLDVRSIDDCRLSSYDKNCGHSGGDVLKIRFYVFERKSKARRLCQSTGLCATLVTYSFNLQVMLRSTNAATEGI